MKKILILFSLVATCTFAQAQFGVKAGLNLSSWHGDDISGDDVDMLAGFYVGGFYNVKISEMFSFQPDLVFSAEGVKAADIDLKYLINYINLAPLIRLNTKGGFFVGTGPQIGFLLSAKVKSGGDSESIKDEMKSTNFSWAFMLGYQLKNGFGFYGRYNLGLSNIIDSDDSDVKTAVIALGLRYSFLASKGGGK